MAFHQSVLIHLQFMPQSSKSFQIDFSSEIIMFLVDLQLINPDGIKFYPTFVTWKTSGTKINWPI